MFLLDTDTCVRFLRDDAEVKQQITRRDPDHIYTSIMTVYELRVGIEKSMFRINEKIRDLNALLGLLVVVPFSNSEVSEAAQICAELEKRGTPLEPSITSSPESRVATI